jgi:CHASE2 domain-containing sensor protein
VNAKANCRRGILKPALGAALAALCGLILWNSRLGDAWVNASYDYLFRFGARATTNNVTLIMMDNESYDYFHQSRGPGQFWDRALHTQLLNKLADDGCALLVMDCFFREPRDPGQDEALANAMRHQRHIVLMADQTEITQSENGHPTLVGVRPLPPAEPFCSAASKNWGVGHLDPDPDLIVRRHWPFYAPGPSYPSLSQAAARIEGLPRTETSQEQWLRYYGQDGTWTRLSYRFALTKPTNYFRGQIVFIGNQPKSSIPSKDQGNDEFCTPYTRWTNKSTGGVDIVLTSFLNLINDDWLRRAPRWVEGLCLVFTGILLGGGFSRMRPLAASILAPMVAITVMLVAISVSYFTNYWFPWLVIAGGQVPCGLAWALAVSRPSSSPISLIPGQGTRPHVAEVESAPDIPGYKLLPLPFGEGAYGKVWMASNNAGEWRAVKVIYLASFNHEAGPFEREFKGISRYQAISDKHPSLLRVDYVSQKFAGHFYYVMELGDSLEPGWEQEPSKYKPRDLASERARAQGGRLPTRECLRIGLELSDALVFLHRHGLAHRDIKPQNVIFVNGRPKLADFGLVAEIRPREELRTSIGTPGFMPPSPELPGTAQADIYALGILLYILSTGRNPAFFPEISTTLAGTVNAEEFFAMNTIILKACQPDPSQRFTSAMEMHRALQDAQKSFERGSAEKRPNPQNEA